MQRRMASEQNGRGLATSPSLSEMCKVCHSVKAEIPISNDDGEELEICEACDKRLFGTDLTEEQDIILEALADYRAWWCDDDEIDREKRKQIDRAVEVMKNIK